MHRLSLLAALAGASGVNAARGLDQVSSVTSLREEIFEAWRLGPCSPAVTPVCFFPRADGAQHFGLGVGPASRPRRRSALGAPRALRGGSFVPHEESFRTTSLLTSLRTSLWASRFPEGGISAFRTWAIVPHLHVQAAMGALRALREGISQFRFGANVRYYLWRPPSSDRAYRRLHAGESRVRPLLRIAPRRPRLQRSFGNSPSLRAQRTLPADKPS